MYGAILGDIVGSIFEFDRPGWTKDFEFLTGDDHWTDDTVMTIAVAEALIGAGKDAQADDIKKAVIKSMQKWGRKYPYAGYGGRFSRWLRDKDPRAYGSWGNGSAMRVSAAGWLYDSLERTREVARATAEVTHNHPEGIKGAECTAAVIYMGRNGASKEEIAEYVEKEFGYDYSESLEEMRARHRMDESCMDALPKALRSFMDGGSVEDVIRNAVSLGGDTDTIAAIAGAMAEGMYGMTVLHRGEVLLRTTDDMRAVLAQFDRALGKYEFHSMGWFLDEDGNFIDEESDASTPEVNRNLNRAFYLFRDQKNEDKRAKLFISFLRELVWEMSEGVTVEAPFVDADDSFFEQLDIENAVIGEERRLDRDVRLRMDTMKDPSGDEWLPLFFTTEEIGKGETGNILIPVEIKDVLTLGLKMDSVKGVVINPFDKPFTMNKELLEKVLGECERLEEMKKADAGKEEV